jgi:holliday junction DNA helicase RuvA
VIERLTGNLVHKGPTQVQVEAGPICLELSVPLSTSQRLPEAGSACALWTHLVWREDGPSLFGFLTKAERELFRLLILVQGVGPRIALSVLSHLTPAELASQIRQRALEGLTQVPGIGPKTAGRILVELGPRVDRMDPAAFGGEVPGEGGPTPAGGEDAVSALTALGYAAKDAQKAVARVLREDASIGVDECIRRALKALVGPRGGV